jgi:hypothetical protein
MATVYPFKILILSPGCPAAARETKYRGRAKLGICTKVHGEINTSCDKKYNLENPHSAAVQKIKNSPVIVGLEKAQKLCVSEISHPAE